MTWTRYTIWYLFGFGAQALFTARFVVQWIASERRGRSVVPVHFWILSLCGSGCSWCTPFTCKIRSSLWGRRSAPSSTYAT